MQTTWSLGTRELSVESDWLASVFRAVTMQRKKKSKFSGLLPKLIWKLLQYYWRGISVFTLKLSKPVKHAFKLWIDTHFCGSWWCIGVERWDHFAVVLWGNKESFLRSWLVDQSRSIVQRSCSCLHILWPRQHNGVILPYNIDAICPPFLCHVLRQFKVLWVPRKVRHFGKLPAIQASVWNYVHELE